MHCDAINVHEPTHAHTYTHTHTHTRTHTHTCTHAQTFAHPHKHLHTRTNIVSVNGILTHSDAIDLHTHTHTHMHMHTRTHAHTCTNSVSVKGMLHALRCNRSTNPRSPQMRRCEMRWICRLWSAISFESLSEIVATILLS